jgi:hypothetical protein
MRLEIDSFPFPARPGTQPITAQVDAVDDYFFDGLAEQAVITSGISKYRAVKYPNESVWKTDFANKLQ